MSDVKSPPEGWNRSETDKAIYFQNASGSSVRFGVAFSATYVSARILTATGTWTYDGFVLETMTEEDMVDFVRRCPT